MSIETDQKNQAEVSATATQVKKRVFSGIQPTGNIHLGNYLGAIRNWVGAQDQYDNIFCIVDLHAITLPINAKELHQNTRKLAALYLACGLDTRYCNLFVQSHVHEHAEMSWIMNCYTPMGWLNRMTQFKTKADENPESVNTGLYCYPVLMACDILLYQTHYVPVGDDQRQHVEITRDIAQRFNSLYKKRVFTLPEAQIRDTGARIMSLENPSKKMSKSDPNPASRINLLDEPKVIKQKIARATTDSLRLVAFDPERPGITNLLTIYQMLTGQPEQEIEAEFAGKGYGDFKAALTDRLVATLEPIQRRYNEYINDMVSLEGILKQGADRVRPQATATLNRVKEVIGLG
ncbi:tryptophan--tRNA ligase [Ktedonosporobacter rubrisoli]|uniref:Tryptophan--tRNA ligase n=1 Tax=Ktedonosporobacter rubrisoli TaxID=2509675 RepID=A0A4P6JSF5_KTERU|nr:tryptophan--tRNA ligase [Ktedonosporobacter rubrisoli]QBD77786.1 tryptophan--tRNA ligase [Ktedonosporobacter rubrisoli]